MTKFENYIKSYSLVKLGVSKRESQVLYLVILGYTNKEIADKLCVAEKTVKFHLTSIFKITEVRKRPELIWWFPIFKVLLTEDAMPEDVIEYRNIAIKVVKEPPKEVVKEHPKEEKKVDENAMLKKSSLSLGAGNYV